MALGEPSAQLLDLLTGDGPILVLTGAGISAESGLSTFRGPGGLWENRDPMSLATPEAFEADPALVWRFYAWRRERAAAASPNPAHHAVAALEAERQHTTLVTQNVDGLHERAGSRRVIRLHGSLWVLRCTREGTETEDRRLDLDPLPCCGCGALLRPAVVWFGESLSPAALARAEEAARSARLALVVGTSGLVYPAASLPGIAKSHGAYLVEINPEPTPLSASVDERFQGRAGEILPAVLAAAGIRTTGPP